MDNLPLFLFMGIALIGLFFLNSRNRKQQVKQNTFRDTLVPGVDVMTLSGQLGTIVEVEGDVIIIETTPGVHTRWLRAAIGPVPASVAASVIDDDADSQDGDSLAGDSLDGEIAEAPEYGVREMREDDPGQAPRH